MVSTPGARTRWSPRRQSRCLGAPALALACLLVVAGCTVVPAPKPTEDPQPTGAPEVSAPKPSPTEETVSAVDVVLQESLSTCLIGTWREHLDEWAELAAWEVEEFGRISSITTSGRSLATYDGSRVTWTFEDVVITYTYDDGRDHVRLTRTGQDSARYRFDGRAMLLDDWVLEGSRIELVLVRGGTTTDLLEGIDQDAHTGVDLPEWQYDVICGDRFHETRIAAVDGEPVDGVTAWSRWYRE